MSIVLEKLIIPVAKLFIKEYFGDGIGQASARGILDVALQSLEANLAAANAENYMKTIAARIVTKLRPYFELERISPDDRELLLGTLSRSLEIHISSEIFIRHRLRQEDLVKELSVHGEAHIPHHLRDAYGILLRASAACIHSVVETLPQFNREHVRESLKLLDDLTWNSQSLLESVSLLQSNVDSLKNEFEKLGGRRESSFKGFESHYLTSVQSELNYVEILGMENLDAKSRESMLSVAYLSLNVQFKLSTETVQIDSATLLSLLPCLGNRLLIEGPAGSGKSTLMRWSAIEAAHAQMSGRRPGVEPDSTELDRWINYLDGRRGRAKDMQDAIKSETWLRRIPILIVLRKLQDELNLEELLSLSLITAIRPPNLWVQSIVEDQGRRVLFIFDGIDEVPSGVRRRNLLRQIEKFAIRFPLSQIVVTSRPGAVPQDAVATFTRVVVNELTQEQQDDFVRNWHEALAVNFSYARDNLPVQTLTRAMLAEFDAHEALRRLCLNPLLCGAACALHWLRRRKAIIEAWNSNRHAQLEGRVLPKTIWRLLEDLCKMLVELRDTHSQVPMDEDGLSEQLSYDDKLQILQQIAYDMTEGEMLSSIPRAEVRRSIVRALGNTSGRARPDAVLDFLLTRSGVLRPSGASSLEFTHNTFKAFFAAKHYLSIAKPQTVLRRVYCAGDGELASGLDEIVVLTTASPDHSLFGVDMVRGLVDLFQQKKTFPGRMPQDWSRRGLGYLALRCEAANKVSLPRNVRASIDKMFGELVPPTSNAEARHLALVGERAVRFIRYDASKGGVANGYSVRSLKLINTQASRKACQTFKNSTDQYVAEELVDIMDPMEIRYVLQIVQLISESVSPKILANITTIKPILGNVAITRLNLTGSAIDDDGLVGIEMLRNLRGVHLGRTNITTRALVSIGKLTSLEYLCLPDGLVGANEPILRTLRAMGAKIEFMDHYRSWRV